MENLLQIQIYNELSSIQWGQILFLGLFGAFLFKLLQYHATGVPSKFSPFEFNWRYWITDRNNWNDLILSFFIYCLIIVKKDILFLAFADNIFCKFLLPYKDDSFFYIILGFLMTLIIKMIRNGIDWITVLVNKMYNNDKPKEDAPAEGKTE